MYPGHPVTAWMITGCTQLCRCAGGGEYDGAGDVGRMGYTGWVYMRLALPVESATHSPMARNSGPYMHLYMVVEAVWLDTHRGHSDSMLLRGHNTHILHRENDPIT